jgi:hypothetical protein
MKKNKEVHLRLSEPEHADLKAKASAACMTESAFIRQLIAGNVPAAAPDERFFQAMELIREFSAKIDDVAMKADNTVDMTVIMIEARKWRAFQNALEKAFLRPGRVM